MFEIINDDCLIVMQSISDKSIDMVCTDPPYGINFMGKDWDKALPNPDVWSECFRILKPGGSAVVMSGARLDCLWRVCQDLELAGFELAQTAFFWMYNTGFPKGTDLSKAADERAGREREVAREQRNPRHSYGFNKNHVNPYHGGIDRRGDYPEMISASATGIAKELDGWFTKGKVKPAVEVIIWARKPRSESSELDNMVEHGVGGVNCGDCMLPPEKGNAAEVDQKSRFPANLIVTDNSIGEDSRFFSIDTWAKENGYSEDWADVADSGILNIKKPSRAEKEEGCELLDEKFSGMSNGAQIHGEGYDKGQGIGLNRVTKKKNHHPTCKPVKLMAFLINFLTKKGQTVLDPFCGSGTTGVACIQSKRNFIGVEIEREYVKIANARCKSTLMNINKQQVLDV